MSEIEVGEYVRLDIGKIGKVILTEKGSIMLDIESNRWVGLCCIKSHSKNIIDLIEEGDIVKTGIETIFTECFDNKDNLGYFKELYKNEEQCIKSILTHEQYEANCYKVVE